LFPATIPNPSFAERSRTMLSCLNSMTYYSSKKRCEVPFMQTIVYRAAACTTNSHLSSNS
jgi:hypothetical protein